MHSLQRHNISSAYEYVLCESIILYSYLFIDIGYLTFIFTAISQVCPTYRPSILSVIVGLLRICASSVSNNCSLLKLRNQATLREVIFNELVYVLSSTQLTVCVQRKMWDKTIARKTYENPSKVDVSRGM